jgi:hypothetical protein
MDLKDSPASSAGQPMGVPGPTGWINLMVPPYFVAVVPAGVVAGAAVVGLVAVVVVAAEVVTAGVVAAGVVDDGVVMVGVLCCSNQDST